jgi:diadenosine tetraphosphate (Ap4A) HIT family hydrolase
VWRVDWRGDRIGSARRGENPTVLAELGAGYAVIGDVQFLPGYCVLLGTDPAATALADMPRIERVRFLADADLLATAVERACRDLVPGFRRVNVEVLGNADAFVHAHVWPRYAWEPPGLVARPVWLHPTERWHDPATALGDEHDELRARIRDELEHLARDDAVEVRAP